MTKTSGFGLSSKDPMYSTTWLVIIYDDHEVAIQYGL